jgi:hypothetical protein
MSSGWPHDEGGARPGGPWSGMGWVRYLAMVRQRPGYSPDEWFPGLSEPDPRVVVPQQRQSPEEFR